MPRRALLLCALGALPTVAFDAALRADPARAAVALPLTLGAVWLCLLPARGLAAATRALHTRGWAGPLLAAGALFGVGFYASNVLLVDPPLARATCLGYLLSAASALVCALVLRRAPQLALATLAFVWLGFAAAFCTVDRLGFPLQYPTFHLGARLAAIGCASTAAWLSYERVGRFGCRAVGALTLTLLLASLLLPSRILHHALFATQTVEGPLVKRALERPWVARRLALRRCTFGATHAWLPADYECPTPRPLSWTTPATPIEAEGTRAPAILLLVTVDAFRCGLGLRDRAPFRDGCPRLVARTGRGAALGSVQVSVPSTRASILGIHCAGPEPCLARTLAALGYHATGIITHQNLALEPVRASFDQWDDSLAAHASENLAITGPATTERVLEALRRRATPRFVWAHYYDPHDPYVPARSSHWSPSAEAAYADELRRTDAALDALLDGVDALGEPALVLVSADHGESFDEHGTTHHGYELYETALRVPLAVFAFHDAALPSVLPRQSAELGAYLRAAAERRPFENAPPAVSRTDTAWTLGDGTHKLILDHGSGRLELYDLSADPEEREELARERPERVNALLAGMAAAL